MNRSLVLAMIVLPGTGVILVPAVILWVSRNTRFASLLAGPGQIVFWVGLGALTIGLAISIWTVMLFANVGRGTPAPWDPPKKLVIRGPYRHVRNPMITGVLFMLLAEALFFSSWPLAGWTVIFFLGNAIYFPLIEEKGLVKRFGDKYVAYRKHVPRWIPRLRPWDQANGDQPNDSEDDVSHLTSQRS